MQNKETHKLIRVSRMCTTLRRERSFRKTCAPRASEGARRHLQTYGVLRTARKTIEFFSGEMSIKRTAPRRKCHGGAQVMRLPRGLDLDGAGLEERPGEVECGQRTLPARILNTTSIWIQQGIGLAQRQRGGGGAAFSAWLISVKLLHGLRLGEQKYCKV